MRAYLLALAVVALGACVTARPPQAREAATPDAAAKPGCEPPECTLAPAAAPATPDCEPPVCTLSPAAGAGKTCDNPPCT
jgi:hypothetical protein